MIFYYSNNIGVSTLLQYKAETGDKPIWNLMSAYIYKKPVKKSYYSNFRRYMLLTLILLIAFGTVGYFIYSGLHVSQQASPISAAETSVITGNKQTFTNDYFQFEDVGSWVIDKNNSTADKLVYHKFRKNVIQAEMIVYINQDPIPLYSAVPRALPIRIVNNNSFQVTNVSSPCGGQYAKGELHKVKPVQVNNATILCDPDSPQYFVAFSEINGDYHLHLKRPNGTPIEFVITYKDLGLDPQPTSINNIAGSFKTK
jgi:hypothetical protein